MSAGSHKSSAKRIALAHDWVVARRGGEAVLAAVAESLAEFGEVGPLFTMFDSGVRISARVDAMAREVSLLNSLPMAHRLRRWLLPAYHGAVAELSQRLAREHERRPFDLLVSTSSAAILGLCAPAGVPHLCYLHTPARYVWSQGDVYARASRLQAMGLELWGGALRELDRDAARGVTTFIANSRHTAALACECYGREARVIPPPVRTDWFTPDDGPREEFWLAAGALEPYKRFDLAIESAEIAGRDLTIVGNGTCLASLRARAGPRVRFITGAGDELVRALMRRARLLIFPQVEDFGIIAVEAQACGLPVVARSAGGALDTVLEGVTGMLVESDDAGAFARAAARCPAPDSPAIREHAERYSVAAFSEAFGAVVGEILTTPR